MATYKGKLNVRVRYKAGTAPNTTADTQMSKLADANIYIKKAQTAAWADFYWDSTSVWNYYDMSLYVGSSILKHLLSNPKGDFPNSGTQPGAWLDQTKSAQALQAQNWQSAFFPFKKLTLEQGHIHPSARGTLDLNIEAEMTEPPQVSDIRVSATNPRKPIRVTWDSIHQENAIITVGTKLTTIYNTSVDTVKYVDIPADTFKDGDDYTITVKATSTLGGKLDEAGWGDATQSVKFVTPKPTIQNFKPTGQINPLAQIEVTWDSTLQERYTIDVYAENKKIYTVNGGRETRASIPPNILYDGDISLVLSVSDDYTTISHTEVVRVANNPKISILGLEPSDSARNVGLEILISWTTVNQKRYRLELFNNDLAIKTYTGTDETEITLPPYTLSSGTARLRLTVFNTAYGEEVSATREAVFTVFDKPKPPEIFSPTRFRLANPTIEWRTSDEQQTFQIMLFGGDSVVLDSGMQLSNVKEYRISEDLKSNTYYTVKIRIENSQNLWSDWAEQEIYIYYDALPPSDIKATSNTKNKSVTIEFSSVYDPLFYYNQLWRSVGGGQFKLIAMDLESTGVYIDKYAPGGSPLHYKIVSIGKNGVKVDSPIATTILELTGYRLSYADAVDDGVDLKFNYSVGFAPVVEKELVKYLGSRRPTLETGARTLYYEGDFKFDVTRSVMEKLIEMFTSYRVLHYRDGRGMTIFCDISDLKDEYFFRLPNVSSASFSLTEIENDFDFDEVPDRARFKELFLDGTWSLGDGHDLLGYYDLTGWGEDE